MMVRISGPCDLCAVTAIPSGSGEALPGRSAAAPKLATTAAKGAEGTMTYFGFRVLLERNVT